MAGAPKHQHTQSVASDGDASCAAVVLDGSAGPTTPTIAVSPHTEAFPGKAGSTHRAPLAASVLRSAESCSVPEPCSAPFSAATRHAQELCMPVSREAIVRMEQCFAPPSVEIVHELYFNPRLKLSAEAMRRECGLAPANLNRLVADPYWQALAAEIAGAAEGAEMPLLRAAVDGVREMLLHLYPRSQVLADHVAAGLVLDGAYVAARVSSGTADVAAFASALGDILKANCAPKRDALVDHVVAMGAAGAWLGMLMAVAELVELMTFDLANYHMCQRRAELVAGLVSREQLRFADADTTAVRLWMRDHALGHSFSHSAQKILNAHDTVLAAFVSAASAVSEGGALPPTFALDGRRMRELRGLFHETTVLATALVVYGQFVAGAPAARGHAALRTEAKTRITRALAAPDVCVAAVAEELLLVLACAHGRPLPAPRAALLRGLVDGALDPAHRLHATLRTRVAGAIRTQLGAPGVAPALGDALAPLAEELEYVCARFAQLWALHWRVHGPLYERVHREI